MSSADRLSALRRELEKRGWDGFLVPRSDEHQGEYVPPGAERLAWLTGFTGSAGQAAVLLDKAVRWIRSSSRRGTPPTSRFPIG
jgi:Xaa-Pro aminopeptidase